MTPEERIQCILACTRLCEDFAYTIDRRQYDAFLALFAPDPVLDRMGEQYRGHEGLRRFCAARPLDRHVRHLCSNIRIDPTGPGTASGTSAATMYQALAAPDADFPFATPVPLIAEYQDTYLLTDQGWKIKSRKVGIAFLP